MKTTETLLLPTAGTANRDAGSGRGLFCIVFTSRPCLPIPYTTCIWGECVGGELCSARSPTGADTARLVIAP